MATNPLRVKRLNYFSNPKAQRRIIFFFVVLTLVYSVCNIWISIHALRRFGRELIAHPSMQTAARTDVNLLLEQQCDVLLFQLVLFTFLVLVMLTFAAVLLSHRVGGPIYRLKSYLQATVSGGAKPAYVAFRKEDFFHDLAEAFNRFQDHHGLMSRNASGEQDDTTVRT